MKTLNVIQLPTALSSRQRTSARTTKTAEIMSLSEFRQKGTGSQVRPILAKDEPLTAGDIWNAIAEQRMVMHYQPQYDMSTGKTVAAEALVRLVDVAGQLIYPDRFIEMVEQSDLIVPLGRAVIEQVCADLAAFRAEGFALQRIAINLSANQLNIDSGLP